ncbi:MAG: glycosyltransferase [Bacteroidales bacterium]
MKIIHVTDSSIQNFDGISTYINELILSSESKGDEVLLLCTTPTDKSNLRAIQYKGKVIAYKSLRFPGKPKLIVPIKTGITKTIHEFNPDLIWIHSVGTIGTKAARIAKGKYKVVCTKHSFDGDLWCLYLKIPASFQWFIHFAANRFEKIVADACYFFIYHFNDTTKIKDKDYFNKFVKFPPPIQLRFLENQSVKELNPNQLTLGFCGRCEPDKDIENTYLALQMFQKKHPKIEITFYLIGDGPVAKPLAAKYKSIKTIITGYTADVIPYLDRLDGFILSSRHETTSLSSLEAYARGIPIFSLPIGYLSEIKNIDNFYLFENIEKLVELLETIFLTQKRGRKIPKKNMLGDLVISYSELLHRVTDSIKSR